MAINIKALTKLVEDEIKALSLPLDAGGLQTAIASNAQKFAIWGVREAQVRGALDKAERKLKETEGNAYIEINDEASKRNKRMTEAGLKAVIRSNETIVALNDTISDLTGIAMSVSAIVQAYSQRGFAAQALLKSVIDEMAMGQVPRRKS